MKGKIAKDIGILINEGIAAVVLLALVIILKPNADFTRGLFVGFGTVLAVILVLIAARRLSGKRCFGERDERETMLEGKAASVAIFVTVLALALFIILAASIPAVRNVDSTSLAVVTVLALTAVYRIGAIALKRAV